MANIPFKNVEIATIPTKIKTVTGVVINRPIVRLKDSKVSCRCFINCPTAIVGNGCVGAKLTQTCGVGRITSGENVVTKQVAFGGVLCKNTTMVLTYDFGFTFDEVTFIAIAEDGSELFIGSTGCIRQTGTFVFIIPAGSIALKTVSTFACNGANVNSSIDFFNISCG